MYLSRDTLTVDIVFDGVFLAYVVVDGVDVVFIIYNFFWVLTF
jgi:hypothetical protein